MLQSETWSAFQRSDSGKKYGQNKVPQTALNLGTCIIYLCATAGQANWNKP